MTHSQYRLFVWYLAQRLGLDPCVRDRCLQHSDVCCFDAMAFTFSFAAYNLVRLPKLIVEAG